MADSLIFHIDVNSAFLSWESVERLKEDPDSTDLRTIHSAIGGDKESRHGIIIAKSVSAAKMGVRTAETIGEALKKCPDLTLVPPRMAVYKTYSKAFIEILRTYTDTVEQFSIDEAFMDMSESCPLFGTPIEAAANIAARIKNELGFTVNIGISSNKLLAKMASDFEKPDKIHTLFPDEIAEKMWPLPVSELFLVGKSTCRKLRLLGIHTIGELAAYDASILTSHLGKHGTLIHNYACGVDSSRVASEREENKGFGNSTTIRHDVTSEAEAKQILRGLCETVAKRLRDAGMSAYVIAVSVKDFRLKTSSHQTTLLSPTNVTAQIYDEVCILFDELWDGTPIRLLGVQTSKVTGDTGRQLTMFDMAPYGGERTPADTGAPASVSYEKAAMAEKAMDSLRARFGDDIVSRGMK